jgi:hypothetical protein
MDFLFIAAGNSFFGHCCSFLSSIQSDKQASWETDRKQKGNPLVKYFSSWQQMQKLKNPDGAGEEPAENDDKEVRLLCVG